MCGFIIQPTLLVHVRTQTKTSLYGVAFVIACVLVYLLQHDVFSNDQPVAMATKDACHGSTYCWSEPHF